jgi:hypothetical protein
MERGSRELEGFGQRWRGWRRRGRRSGVVEAAFLDILISVLYPNPCSKQISLIYKFSPLFRPEAYF